ASRTFCTAGSKRPMSTAMMAITTSSSIKVNPNPCTRLRRIPGPPLKKRWNESIAATASPRQAGRIKLAFLQPGIDVGDVEVTRVGAARLHLDLLRRGGVPLGRNPIHGHDVRRAWSGDLLFLNRSLAVPRGKPDEVLSRLQAVLPIDAVLPVQDSRTALPVL